MPFLGKFGPKSQNYQFKLKFGSNTNSHMNYSMAVFTFFVDDDDDDELFCGMVDR